MAKYAHHEITENMTFATMTTRQRHEHNVRGLDALLDSTTNPDIIARVKAQLRVELDALANLNY